MTRGHVVGAALTMIAVLGALGTALLLRDGAGAAAVNPVLAVVLVLTSSRFAHDSLTDRVAAAAELVVIAPAATGVGWLIVHVAWLGQALLVAGLSIGIYARRFGPVVRKVGRMIALPFLALLVAPVPMSTSGGVGSVMLWAPVTALVALSWSTMAAVVGERWHLATSASTATATRVRAGSRRRLDAPTRMALQMALALGTACALGHLFFEDRWAWTLLSAFVVMSGNRGRGDVLHKAGLRLVGAGLGTLGATELAAHIGRGDRLALVALFAVMALALVLRATSYAFWAGGVTAMLALLHGYYGESGGGLLGERLLGVLLGCAVGVAVAWLVTPVRSSDVLRAGIADCLAALNADLAALNADLAALDADLAAPSAALPDADRPAGQLPAALARLDALRPTWRARARLPAQDGTLPLQAIAALHRLHPLPDAPVQRRRLQAAVGQARRALARPHEPLPEGLPPELDLVVRTSRSLRQPATARRRSARRADRIGTTARRSRTPTDAPV